MNPTGLEALAMLREFLIERVLPSVPAEIASELRAGIKILDTAASELDELYPLTRRECVSLLALCAEISVASTREPGDLAAKLRQLEDELTSDFISLRALLAFEASVHAVADELFEVLQNDPAADEKNTNALKKLYTWFERRAANRVGWQSVFPTTK